MLRREILLATVAGLVLSLVIVGFTLGSFDALRVVLPVPGPTAPPITVSEPTVQTTAERSTTTTTLGTWRTVELFGLSPTQTRVFRIQGSAVQINVTMGPTPAREIECPPRFDERDVTCVCPSISGIESYGSLPAAMIEVLVYRDGVKVEEFRVGIPNTEEAWRDAIARGYQHSERLDGGPGMYQIEVRFGNCAAWGLRVSELV